MNFYSLSMHPGQTGRHFYTSVFAKMGLPYTYTPLGTLDVFASIDRLRNLASGISISMPYKSSVIKILDYCDPVVEQFGSCNTIKVVDGKLHGYNTDYAGAQHVVSMLEAYDQISILGDGAMGTMFKKILGDRAVVYSRKLNTWNNRYRITGAVINCTALGTSTHESPFLTLPAVSVVADLALKQNQLEQQCADASVKYVCGIEFYRHQFMAQYKIYTGQQITIEDILEL